MQPNVKKKVKNKTSEALFEKTSKKSWKFCFYIRSDKGKIHEIQRIV